MTSSVYNGGVSETRSYSTDNTLASSSYSSTAISDLSYGWDDNKDKTSETIGGTMSRYGLSLGGSGYDAEGRLVAWNRTSGLAPSWNHSLVGEWNSITENSWTKYGTHDDAQESFCVDSQSMQHDVKGNQTLIPAVPWSGSSEPLSLNRYFDTRLTSADVESDSSATSPISATPLAGGTAGMTAPRR